MRNRTERALLEQWQCRFAEAIRRHEDEDLPGELEQEFLQACAEAAVRSIRHGWLLTQAWERGQELLDQEHAALEAEFEAGPLADLTPSGRPGAYGLWQARLPGTDLVAIGHGEATARRNARRMLEQAA